MHLPLLNFTKSSSSALATNILSSIICKTASLVQRRQEYYENRLFNVPVGFVVFVLVLSVLFASEIVFI
jgi:hypothetical protein